MLFASIAANANQATIEAALIPAAATVLVALLGGGGIGYFLKYYLDRKQAFATANGAVKRKMYKKYLDKLTSLNNIGKLTPEELEVVKTEFGKHSSEFYSTGVLFASPQVVKAYADFVRHTDSPQDEAYTYDLMLKMSRLYRAMRSDIGLSNKGLGHDGELLLRGNINDYDATIRPYTTRRKRFARKFKRRASKKAS